MTEATAADGVGGAAPPPSMAADHSTPSRRDWLAAATLGVLVSVTASIAIGLLLGGATQAQTVGGLIVGTLAAGAIVKARTISRWAASAAVVVGAQLVLGLAVVVAMVAGSAF